MNKYRIIRLLFLAVLYLLCFILLPWLNREERTVGSIMMIFVAILAPSLVAILNFVA